MVNEFGNGYIFRRLDERAKVFIEYGPAEKAWIPVTAPNYLMIGCFWVSGKYKNKGHGKALLAIANLEARQALVSQAVKRQWSVRDLERRVRSILRPASESGKKAAGPVHAHMADLQRRLGEHLGTRVRITPGRRKGTGKLIIEFYNLDQFEGLMQRLKFDHD